MERASAESGPATAAGAAALPRDGRFDSTLELLGDPYGFIGKTARRLETDAFRTRLRLRPTICMTGREAAQVFYDPERFVREGAAPRRLKKTLFGEGAVQGLDGAGHRHRKGMLLEAAGRDEARRLGEIALRCWLAYAAGWEAGRRAVTLYPAACEVFCRAVCEWAGVPLPPGEVSRRTRQLTLLFDGAGAVGPRHRRSRRARRHADRWAAGLVEEVRAGLRVVAEDRPLAVVARHRDEDGELLPADVAAVELINLLRPTVAVSVYAVFAALALHRFPRWKEELAADGGAGKRLDPFVHEVRRYFPFFPAVAARVRRDFEWRGHRFPAGRRTLLDLYGTCHDPRVWDAPEEFRPERFLGRGPDPFGFVPQGGGDHAAGHRCAGEWATIELLRGVTDLFAQRLTYHVPDQDLTVDTTRLPALPRSRFVMARVRLVA